MGVDPAAFFRAEERDDAADVIGYADAAQGSLCGEKLTQAGMAQGVFCEVGFDGTGSNGVRGDAASTEFFRQIAGEDFDGTFHGGICSVTRNGEACEASGGVHDAATIGEQGQELLREEEDAFEMNVEQVIKIFLGSLGEGSSAINASVVDEKIEVVALPFGLERFGEGFHEGVEAAGLRDIELEQGGFAAELFDLGQHGFAFGFAFAIGEDDVGAIAGEFEGGVAAKAAAAAGDEGDFMGVVHGDILIWLNEWCFEFRAVVA